MDTDDLFPASFVVRGITRDTKDTVTLRVSATDDRAVGFRPGQFCMLYVFGVGEIPISISGRSRGGELLFTVRSVGLVSERVSALRRNDTVGVRGPFGSGWPMDEALGLDLLILAGGLGLAPLRSAIREACERREELGRLTLICAARTPDELLYRREIEKWAKLMPTTVTVDIAPAGWKGSVGLITAALGNAAIRAERTTVFMCGPEIMMRVCARDLLDRGVEPKRIHLALERNMKCAVGFCGHCQLGPSFVCKDGPVYDYAGIRDFFETREM